MRHPLRTAAGFTLIEVMIAITLVGLLTTAMLVSIRIGLNSQGKADQKFTDLRRMLGAQRALEQQLNNFMPVKAIFTPPNGGMQTVPFFEGQPQNMRFVSSYSLRQAARGRPQILEFLVIAGEDRGFRLIVNESPYTGPYAAGARIADMTASPESGRFVPVFVPIEPGPASFVLADRLAYCQLSYLEQDRSTRAERWRPDWTERQWPLAVRIEMAPLEADPARLHPVTVTSALHANPTPDETYTDRFDKP